MKRLFFIWAAVIAMSSCGVTKKYTFYQVYQATPMDDSHITTSNNGMLYEDENCIISYAFWAKNGNAGFTIYNKTDRVLCIDMNKSFFIRNGEAFNYYPQQGFEEEGIDFRQIVAIPPKTYRSLKSQAIWQLLFVDCELDRFPTTSDSLTFSAEDSPIRFSNYLTYNLGESTPVTVIENAFYVSRVTNYPSPAVIGFQLREEKPCLNKTNELKKYYKPEYPVKVYDKIINIDISDCFYVSYERNSSLELYKVGDADKMIYDEYYDGYILQESENSLY